MLKRMVLPLAILLVGSFTIVVLVVAKPKPEANPTEAVPTHVAVKVIEASPQTARLNVTAQGSVTPKRHIDLVAQVTGEIVAVSEQFNEGGFFKAGETLLQIDDSDYQAALLRAQAQLAEAERRLAEEQGLNRQAKREWRDLGNSAANDLFMRKPQLAAAKAEVAAAQAELQTAELNLERTRIKLPFDGRVHTARADLGQFVSRGASLGQVFDSQVVEVRLPLTERQAALVELPLLAQNRSSMPQVTLRGTVAGQAHQWVGALVRADAFVDQQSRMYYAVVEVKDPFAGDVPLIPGLFVEAEIEGKPLADVWVLPKSALYQRNILLTLDDSSSIKPVKVDVLSKTDETLWAKADLPDNTRFTLEKHAFTPAGTLIEPIIETRSTADTQQ